MGMASGDLAGDDDALRTYLTEIAAFPLLTRDDEIRLGRAVDAGDEDARRKLTCLSS